MSAMPRHNSALKLSVIVLLFPFRSGIRWLSCRRNSSSHRDPLASDGPYHRQAAALIGPLGRAGIRRLAALAPPPPESPTFGTGPWPRIRSSTAYRRSGGPGRHRVEVASADLLAWDRERGEPPLSQGFSVIEKRESAHQR